MGVDLCHRRLKRLLCNGRMGKKRIAEGVLTLVCSKTGREISTGVVYTQSDLKRAKRAQLLLYCPSCRESHLFVFSKARLKLGPPTNGGQTEPSSDSVH